MFAGAYKLIMAAFATSDSATNAETNVSYSKSKIPTIAPVSGEHELDNDFKYNFMTGDDNSWVNIKQYVQAENVYGSFEKESVVKERACLQYGTEKDNTPRYICTLIESYAQ